MHVTTPLIKPFVFVLTHEYSILSWNEGRMEMFHLVLDTW